MQHSSQHQLDLWMVKKCHVRAFERWLEIAVAAGSPKTESLRRHVQVLRAEADALMAASMEASGSKSLREHIGARLQVAPVPTPV